MVRNIINDSASLLKRSSSEKSNVELVEALRSNFSFARDVFEVERSTNREVITSAISLYNHEWIAKTAGIYHIPAFDFSHGLLEERGQYDITLKLFFLPGSSGQDRCRQAREAVDLVLQTLHMPSVDLLIVSFPGISFEPTNGCPDDVIVDSTDMDAVLDAWTCLEGLKDQGLLHRIGIAEFGQQRLQDLLPRVRVRPAVDQINVSDVCVVPKDLVAYARAEGIELFTHSDCTNILPQGTIRSLLGASGAGILVEPGDPHAGDQALMGDIQPQWVVKYTAIVRNRGVIENKGYFAMAELKAEIDGLSG